MQVPQRAWILQRVQAGASKSAIPQRASVPLGVSVAAAVTATTSNRSALAASPGSSGIMKTGCKPARTSRKKRGGGGVSLLACRQYRRGTSAKGDAIRIGVVSIRNHPQLDRSPPRLPLHHLPPHSWLENWVPLGVHRAALTSHNLEWLEQWGRLAELELKWSTCLCWKHNRNTEHLTHLLMTAYRRRLVYNLQCIQTVLSVILTFVPRQHILKC